MFYFCENCCKVDYGIFGVVLCEDDLGMMWIFVVVDELLVF